MSPKTYTVLVKPNSGRDEVLETSEGLVVRTRKKPVDGEANTAVVELLAKHFHVSKTSVVILTGKKSRRKIVKIL